MSNTSAHVAPVSVEEMGKTGEAPAKVVQMETDKEGLISAIMAATDCTSAEAMNTIIEMVERIEIGANPEELLYEIGLEPDYVFALLDFVAD